MTRWRNPSILPLFDAGPFGAAHRLTFDGGVPEPAKLADVLADFLNRPRNIVHVSPAAKEDVVRQPDGLLVGRPLRDGAVIQFFQVKGCGAPPAQSREVIRVNREQRALINRLVKQAITRNAFRFERAQERRPGDPVEVLRKILEDALVAGKTSVARVVIGLLDWKLNAPRSPVAPAPLFCHLPPWACAQSSMTTRLRSFAIRQISSRSANRMARWTGRMARVFGVRAFSISPASRQ